MTNLSDVLRVRPQLNQDRYKINWEAFDQLIYDLKVMRRKHYQMAEELREAGYIVNE